MTIEERVEHLAAFVEALADPAKAAARQDRLERLIQAAEVQCQKWEQLHRDIQELLRQWRAYLLTLKLSR